MSWYDRPYARERPSGYRAVDLSTVSVTSTLIAVNAFVAFLTLSGSQPGRALEWLGAMQGAAVLHGQVWRLLTATYLHANLPHVLFNMLALYFLGPPLEQVWGRRQFFLVYTLGGIAGNVLFTLAGALGYISPLVVGLGASGSILTLLGAAAVLFPNARIYVYFMLPLRIRTAAVLYGLWYIVNVYQRGANYGGDLCHLAGLLVGVAYAYTGGLTGISRPGSLVSRLLGRRGHGAWTTAQLGPREAAEEAVLNRVLGKVRDCGVCSLTDEEREFLRCVSERRQLRP